MATTMAAHVVTTTELVQAELDCRAFARQFPTPQVLNAVRLAETGRLDWVPVAALFARSLVKSLDAVTA